jgi:hypothetical protein
MEKLENFIRENREAFDSETPDLRVWAALNKQLSENAQPSNTKIVYISNWLPRLRIAASVALLVVTGIGIGLFLSRNNNLPDLADISPEHAEMENYYKKEIGKKERELVQISNTANYPEVKKDLASIDQVMLELREELMNAPKGSREQVVRTLIESYKNKVEILERVLEESKNHSNSNISKPFRYNEKDTI